MPHEVDSEALFAALRSIAPEGQADVVALAARLGVTLEQLVPVLDELGMAPTLIIEGGQAMGVAAGKTVHQTNHYTLTLPAGLTLNPPDPRPAARRALQEAAEAFAADLSKRRVWGSPSAVQAEYDAVQTGALQLADVLLQAVGAQVHPRDVKEALRQISRPALHLNILSYGKSDEAELCGFGAYLVVMALAFWAVIHREFAWLKSALRTQVVDSDREEVPIAMLRYLIREVQSVDRWTYLRDVIERALPQHFHEGSRLHQEYGVAEAIADAEFQRAQNGYFEKVSENFQLLLGGTHYGPGVTQAYLRNYVADFEPELEASLPGIVEALWTLQKTSQRSGQPPALVLGQRP